MKRLALVGQGASLARTLKLALLAGSAIASVAPSLAGPQGGEVAQGNATISNPVAGTTKVDQQSDKAVINWSSFNVGKDEKAIFNQPNATSVMLNRIFDQNPSVIAGLVSANGRLVLINANGMVFESGATVNAAGLIATTADISNDDFIASNYRFDTPGAANASIVNNGLITADEGGVVAFVAPSVRNSGVITAKLGRVALGAGNTFVLDLYGDNLISFPVSAEIAQQLVGPDGKPSSLVDVSGKIEASSVQLTARAVRGIIDNVINVDGEIIASGVQQSPAGSTFLTGGGFVPSALRNNRSMPHGEATLSDYGGINGTYGGQIQIDGGANGVRVGGTLNAAGPQGGSIGVAGASVELRGRLLANGTTSVGGDVAIAGTRIALNGATVDASGALGGGAIALGYTGEGASRAINADTVFVSGDSSLRADAIESGDGGRILLWSNLATEFNGALSARGGAQSGDGGFLEISSKDQVGFFGTADASAANGATGTLLFDPKNITIFSFFASNLPSNPLTFSQSSTSSLTINPNSITSVLNTGTAVTLQASNDITVSSNITVNNPGGNGGALTMQAGRSVNINADITTDNGNLTIIANELLSAGVINAQRDQGSAVITMGFGADIVAGTGTVRLAILDGTGKTNLASGDLTVRNISAGNIRVENLGATAGSDVIVSGNLVASGAGTPLVIASQTGTFDNNNGAGALQTPNGRWLVYTNTPAATDEGGLAGTPWYNTSYNLANPTGIAASGNKFVYSQAATLTVTPNNASRAYGDPNPGFTYAITGLLGTDTLAASVQGAPTITTLADVTSSVAGGPYAITAALGTLASAYNYGFSFAPGQLSITPAQLFYLANPSSREYGDPNGTLSGTLGGLRNGDGAALAASGTAVFTSPANAISDVGNYEINGSGLTVISGNYSATILQDPSNTNALSVTPAQLYYLADLATRTYGDFNNDYGGDVIGLKNGEDITNVTDGDLAFISSVTETTGVGSYAIDGIGLVVTDPNYAAIILQHSSNETALTINPAQLFYFADSDEREYGDANPLLTGNVEGLVNGESLESVTDGTLVFTTSATELSNVGEYEILGGGLTVVSANYVATIVQNSSNLTALRVTPAQLTYRANEATRVYGEANPAFSGQVLGLKNSDTVESVASGTVQFLSPAVLTSNVGEYAINGNGLTVTSSNYSSVILQDFDNAFALEIVPAQLSYKATQVRAAYGDPFTITGTVIGLKNGHTLESVTVGTLIWNSDADINSDVGVYGVEGSGLAVTNANYELGIDQAFENSFAVIIDPAQLYYRADPVLRLYGLPNPELTGQVVGLKNDDDIEGVTIGDLFFTTSVVPTTLPGDYGVFGSGLLVNNTNYLTTILQDPFNANALTVQPIPLETVQSQGEGVNADRSAIEEDQTAMTSRTDDLGIVGVGPVSDDMADGKNDQLGDQLCVLGAREAANAPGCVARQQVQGR